MSQAPAMATLRHEEGTAPTALRPYQQQTPMIPPGMIQNEENDGRNINYNNNYNRSHAVTDGGSGPVIIEEGPPLMVTPLEALTDQPAHIDCPFCYQRSLTRVVGESTLDKPARFMVTCTSVMTCACCLLPYVLGRLEEKRIYCGSCGRAVAMIPAPGNDGGGGGGSPPQTHVMADARAGLVPSNYA